MQPPESSQANVQASQAAPTNNNEFLCSVFQSMLRARILENKLSSLYKAGKIVGGVYLGKGQEAVSATLGASLIRGIDYFAPLIRDQAGNRWHAIDFINGKRDNR